MRKDYPLSIVYLFAILAMFFWGISFVWVNQALTAGLRPLTIIFLRLVVACVVLTIWTRVMRLNEYIHPRDYKLFFFLAFAEPFCYFLGETFGMQYISPTLASIIISTIPLLTPIFAYMFLRENVTIFQIVGLVVSFAGVVALVVEDLNLGGRPIGFVLMSIAVLGGTAYGIILKKLTGSYSALTITKYQTFIGMFLFMPLFYIWDYRGLYSMPTFVDNIKYIVMLGALPSSVSFTFLAIVVHRLGIIRTNIFTYLIPVFTSITAFLILRETFTPYKISAMSIVIVGLVLSQLNLYTIKNIGLFMKNALRFSAKSGLLILILFVSHKLLSFPIDTYDFNLPTTSTSPFAASLGGLNVNSVNDPFLMNGNPALLRKLQKTVFGVSFAIPPRDYDTWDELFSSDQLLNNNSLRAITFQSKNVGLSYNVLANERNRLFPIDDSPDFEFYQNYRMASYNIAFADSSGNIHYGFNAKLLNGRMVYLTRSTEENNLEDIFIDSTAWGYSFDLGMTTGKDGFTYGLVVYDVMSNIGWKDHKNGRVRTRIGAGLDYEVNKSQMGTGINARWGFKDPPWYNVYYSYLVDIGEPNSGQKMILRSGMMSEKFKRQDEILFCLGLGYVIKMVNLDMAFQSKGWKSRDTQIMFSISLGE
jgi:drug/metabolite transporter (DMT)-like permease